MVYTLASSDCSLHADDGAGRTVCNVVGLYAAVFSGVMVGKSAVDQMFNLGG